VKALIPRAPDLEEQHRNREIDRREDDADHDREKRPSASEERDGRDREQQSIRGGHDGTRDGQQAVVILARLGKLGRTIHLAIGLMSGRIARLDHIRFSESH
jgi:hypothetical protein